MTELIERHLSGVGRDYLDTFPVVVIEGARQVGKSTLAGQLLKDRTGVMVTLDAPEQLASAVEDPESFLAQGGDGTLVIDKAQFAPELSRLIKLAVDRDRRPGKFLLTGSTDLLRMPGLGDSLAGRAVSLRLRGFSVGEVLQQPDDFLPALLELDDPRRVTSGWTRTRYVEALSLGGFPEVRRLPPRMRRVWLGGYLDRVLNRDAVLLRAGHQSARLHSLIRLIAANQGGELVKARLAEQAAVPPSSITAYLDVLAGVFAIEQLEPWSPNLTSRETGRRKSAVSDSALALWLAQLTPGQLEPITGELLGGHFEAFLATELLKQQSWSREDFRLFHYRDRTGFEVDLIAELGDGSVVGIEIKTSSSYRPEHFKGLRFLRDRLGDRFRRGVVLGMFGQGFQISDRLIGLPASALWELATAQDQR